MNLRMTKILLIITIFSATANGTVLRQGTVSGGPQIMGGMFHGVGNYFDSGLRCIEVNEYEDIEVIHNERSSVTTTTSIDYETMARELGNGFSVGSVLPSGDPLGLSFSFLKSSKETSTSVVFSYKTVVESGSVILKGPYKLTSEAKEVAEMGESEFLDYCGDQFVHRLKKGASAYVTLKIDAGTNELKREIESELGLNVIDFIDVSMNFKKMMKKYNLKGNLTVSAYQEGGFAARINSIFGNGEGVANCNASDFAKCEILLKETVYYFANEFGEQFDHYYRDGSGSGVILLPPTSKTLNYNTLSYCKLAPQDRPVNLDCSKRNITSSLAKLDLDQMDFENEIQRIQEIRNNRSIGLAISYQKILELYNLKMLTNISKIREAKMDCKKDNWSCSSIVQQTEMNYFKQDNDLLERVQNEERIQICFSSGKKAEFEGLKIRLKEKGRILDTLRLFNSLAFDSRECFLIHSPELKNPKFDSIELSAQAIGEKLGECRLRSRKKYSSWLDWNLKEIEITHLGTGYTKTFKGDHFKKRKKCRMEDDATPWIPWKKLKMKGV